MLGVGSLFLVWKLACVLYGRDAAIMSLAVFTLYSLHVGYSATSSSEVPCVFFILLALWFFFSYFYRGAEHLGYLASSGMALSIAGSIRYEPWLVFGTLLVVMPLLWMSHPARRERMKALIAPVVVFASLGGAWPALSMAYFWTKFGDPMYLVPPHSPRWRHRVSVIVVVIGFASVRFLEQVQATAGDEWVAPIARLSGCRRDERRRDFGSILRLRRPDRQAVRATR